MKVGIYDPYLNTLGGGEKYVLSIAEFFKNQADVTVYWDDPQILKKAEERFGLDLNSIKLHKNIFGSKYNYLSRLTNTRDIDYFFYITDGSFQINLAGKNFPIIQYPIRDLNIKLQRIKFRNLGAILCYSKFVKNSLDSSFENVVVLPPRVDSIPNQTHKKNQVLSVGRFTQGKNSKKHEFIVDYWLENKELFNSWELIIAGGVLDQDMAYFESLVNRSRSAKNITLLKNVQYEQICNLYRSAKIYLHAAGYSEDLEMFPERAEHFGISTVEAMSAGCIPVVYAGGGQKEIVSDKIDGFLWHNSDDITKIFNKIMSKSFDIKYLTKNAVMKAKKFDKKHFDQKLSEIIN